MSLAELRTLWHLCRGMPAGGDHARRLEAFYGPQAGDYDGFRERLLAGRGELLAMLKPAAGETIVELGAGTGRNPLYFAAELPSLEQLLLVDLCPALLLEARRRWCEAANVSVIEADAGVWRPAAPVDAVYFSYALTMIPDWRQALANALAMLRPGGRLAVVDFTLGAHQSRLARAFWRRWFAHDGVHLDADHWATLCRLLPRHQLRQCATPVPYLPGARLPYYLFVGIKE